MAIRPARFLDVDETAETIATRCDLVSLQYFNESEGALYLKVYDKATAATHSDTPKFTIGIPAGESHEFPLGKDGARFDKGISLRCTTEVADSGTTGAGANECVVNLTYRPLT